MKTKTWNPFFYSNKIYYNVYLKELTLKEMNSRFELDSDQRPNLTRAKITHTRNGLML